MQRVGLVVVPGFQALSLSALTVFEIANRCLGQSRYAVSVMSEAGAPVRSSFGMLASPDPLAHAGFDTLLVSASMDARPPTRGLRTFLARAAKHTRRIGSLCIGAFTLGHAGLLDGRIATTHWEFIGDLRQQFPRAKVTDDRLFTEDGSIWTSAGMATGLDMALGMVERDCGAGLAREVARGLVVERRRGGAQSQHSALLELEPKSDAIHDVLTHARNHLATRLTVERLARVACLSPRQFARQFRAETGTTPARAVETLRLEAARFLMEQSALPVEVVATETGFGSRERMRRAFVRTIGQSPQALRKLRRTEAVPRTL